jgi:tripeptidyl-peptidase-1
VTAVGATQGIESGTEEIACTSTTGGLITTGGGFSSHYEQPSWQAAAVEKYFSVAKQPVAGYDKSKRGYPDVGVAGHNYAVTVGGQSLAESGTSASAPVFAAMVSLINSARLADGKSAVGFLNPALYAMNNTGVFNDVTSGENNCAAQAEVCCDEGFHASIGWDPLTGWGSLDFQKFKEQI